MRVLSACLRVVCVLLYVKIISFFFSFYFSFYQRTSHSVDAQIKWHFFNLCVTSLLTLGISIMMLVSP